MAEPRNHGKSWDLRDRATLIYRIKHQKRTASDVARELGRSTYAIQCQFESIEANDGLYNMYTATAVDWEFKRLKDSWSREEHEKLIRLYRKNGSGSPAQTARELKRTVSEVLSEIAKIEESGGLSALYPDPDNVNPNPTVIEGNDASPKKRESVMSDIKRNMVTTRLYVGNQEASSLSSDQLLNAIKQENEFIETLDSLKHKTKVTEKLQAKHAANIDLLSNLLDAALQHDAEAEG